LYCQVRAIPRGVQIGACRTPPQAIMRGAVKHAEAFLPIAADVIGQRIPRLLRRRQKGLGDGMIR